MYIQHLLRFCNFADNHIEHAMKSSFGSKRYNLYPKKCFLYTIHESYLWIIPPFLTVLSSVLHSSKLQGSPNIRFIILLHWNKIKKCQFFFIYTNKLNTLVAQSDVLMFLKKQSINRCPGKKQQLFENKIGQKNDLSPHTYQKLCPGMMKTQEKTTTKT